MRRRTRTANHGPAPRTRAARSTEPERAAADRVRPRPDASWAIGAIAFALIVGAAVELVRPGGGRPTGDAGALARAAGERNGELDGAPIELHRLLPDATNGIGARVRLDGTVVGGSGNGGFWVRDLRDNVVLVQGARQPAPGTPVRITGVLTPLPPTAEPGDGPAPHGVGDHALVLRDLTVRPLPDGVELLESR